MYRSRTRPCGTLAARGSGLRHVAQSHSGEFGSRNFSAGRGAAADRVPAGRTVAPMAPVHHRHALTVPVHRWPPIDWRTGARRPGGLPDYRQLSAVAPSPSSRARRRRSACGAFPLPRPASSRRPMVPVNMAERPTDRFAAVRPWTTSMEASSEITPVRRSGRGPNRPNYRSAHQDLFAPGQRLIGINGGYPTTSCRSRVLRAVPREGSRACARAPTVQRCVCLVGELRRAGADDLDATADRSTPRVARCGARRPPRSIG